MKTLIKILAVAMLCLSLAAVSFAADDKAAAKDHLVMKDGKVMMVMAGKNMPLDKELTLNNGTKVAVDGTVTMKDGMKMTMKEGDMMTMDGEIMKNDGKSHGH